MASLSLLLVLYSWIHYRQVKLLLKRQVSMHVQKADRSYALMTFFTWYLQGWPTTQNLSPTRKVARLAIPSRLIWLEVHPMGPMGEDQVSRRAQAKTRKSIPKGRLCGSRKFSVATTHITLELML